MATVTIPGYLLLWRLGYGSGNCLTDLLGDQNLNTKDAKGKKNANISMVWGH
jgi:hypothetical protein